MKEDRLLILSLARHDDITSSTTFHLAENFHQKHQQEVILVEHPYTWIDLLRNMRSEKGKLRWKAAFSKLPVHFDLNGITVVIPTPVIPINFLPPGKVYQFFANINHRTLSRGVNKYLKARNWSSYYYINSYDYHFSRFQDFLKGTISAFAYHCVDPIVKPYTIKHGIKNELETVSNADMVISTAPSLSEKWKQVNPNSYLVPNASDFTHFDSRGNEIASIRSLGSKIIGYFGTIERRIDYQLLLDTFSKRPDWTLLLAGPVEESYVPKEIHELQNIVFTGSYLYRDLPSMIHSVDAVIIPFKCDEAANAIYPLKLFDYLGTGKPVISTQFNKTLLSEFKDIIYLIDEDHALSEVMDFTLSENDNTLSKKRKTVASNNTWDTRAKDFLNILKSENNLAKDEG